MAVLIKVSGLPLTQCAFGPYESHEAAGRALKERGWEKFSDKNWHMSLVARSHNINTIAWIEDIDDLRNPDELPLGTLD